MRTIEKINIESEIERIILYTLKEEDIERLQSFLRKITLIKLRARKKYSRNKKNNNNKQKYIRI